MASFPYQCIRWMLHDVAIPVAIPTLELSLTVWGRKCREHADLIWKTAGAMGPAIERRIDFLSGIWPNLEARRWYVYNAMRLKGRLAGAGKARGMKFRLPSIASVKANSPIPSSALFLQADISFTLTRSSRIYPFRYYRAARCRWNDICDRRRNTGDRWR